MRCARAQSTVELLVLGGVLVAVVATLVRAAPAVAPAVADAVRRAVRHEHAIQDDRWALASPTWGPLIRRFLPTLVLERDRHGQDASVPVDFLLCRSPACAALGTGRPTTYVHLVRRPGRAYIQYWFYYPDSRTSHLPLAALQGRHPDDWEGAIVRLEGGTAAARVTAHLGFTGARPWWAADSGWRAIGSHPVVYRASGSHANGFAPSGIDLAGDDWNGTLGRVVPAWLLPADAAPSARRRFADGALAPWRKRAWIDPEVPGTSEDGRRSPLAAAAAAWAWLVEGARAAWR
jgi:hypothetical protein